MALKRASRRALLCPEDAADLVATRRPLTEVQAVGQFLGKLITRWLTWFSVRISTPASLEFLAMTQAEEILNRAWRASMKGDFQMHTHESDGSASMQEIVPTSWERGYAHIGIAEHAKGLKIRGVRAALALTKRHRNLRQAATVAEEFSNHSSTATIREAVSALLLRFGH